MPKFPYISSPFPYYTDRRFSKPYFNSSSAFFDRSQNEKACNNQTVNYNSFQNSRPTQSENTKQHFESQNNPSALDPVQNVNSNECRFEKQKINRIVIAIKSYRVKATLNSVEIYCKG